MVVATIATTPNYHLKYARNKNNQTIDKQLLKKRPDFVETPFLLAMRIKTDVYVRLEYQKALELPLEGNAMNRKLWLFWLSFIQVPTVIKRGRD